MSLLFGISSAILGGEVVPNDMKTYMAGMRTYPNETSFCGGALISPTHVLTSAICDQRGINYVSVGSHNVNGTDVGEEIKVKSVQLHPNYNPNVSLAWDYAIVTLEKPSKFIPVKLASNDSEIQEGMSAIAMGWGITTCEDEYYSLELRSVAMEAWDNMNCSEVYVDFSPSQLCAGGIANKGTSPGDMGDPLIKENKEGDADDVLLGTNTGGNGCGADNPNVFSRVTTVLPWINSIVNGQ
ncbi:Glucanase inhibitor protein [Phytophthora megakarya]|uniref:Glucanase inhibitor protein n=1 Tax=Phytophthora megakarya TaxID=4795 RepID=A0A225VLQ8_9STRA|nr:Glucanase inhibitor protein [Phytophthora megakarya]